MKTNKHFQFIYALALCVLVATQPISTSYLLFTFIIYPLCWVCIAELC